MKRAIAVITSLAVVVVAFGLWARHEDFGHDGFDWVYRSKYYGVEGDGSGLLERYLAGEARSAPRLLDVLRWKYHEDPTRNPYGLGPPEFFEVQHQALVRLLALQESEFGEEASSQRTETPRADQAGARLVSFENAIAIVEGSASVFPDEFDQHPWEGIFSLGAVSVRRDRSAPRAITDQSEAVNMAMDAPMAATPGWAPGRGRRRGRR